MRKARKKHTIHDVAQAAGVSIYAVSRALNNLNGVNPTDRERILAVSRKLGVRPRATIRSSHFALLIPDPPKYSPGGYITNVTFSLLQELSAQGMGLSMFSDCQVDEFARRIFDGVFLLSWSPETVERVAQLSDFPTVVINRFSLKDRFHVVGWDHVAEGETVARYLLSRGRLRPGFIAPGPKSQVSTQLRLKGFTTTLEAAGHPVESTRIEILDSREYLVSALGRLLGRDVDSLYLPGQEKLGLETVRILPKIFRKRIPEDISIIGGENPGWSEMSDPPLTTVGAPFELLARRSVQHMLDLIKHRETKPTETLVSTPIIERGTVAEP